MLTDYFAKLEYSVKKERYSAEPIRRWREKVGMSCRELARRMGISAAYLSYIERGTKLMTLHQANKLHRVFTRVAKDASDCLKA